ncbi:alpha/beta hydrolase [Micromonospora echinofusca]|uniref:alpha/beta hydrolase n=1 Tax=Micromonospora echinofusca TaxID=47858 RepID=UPI0027DE0AD9|nr:alpha/beta hydrolase [Micromonospora echinofusca]
MTTYAQLWAADPAAWEQAGAAWRGVGDLLQRRAGELAAVAADLDRSWTGAASRAATGRLGTLRTGLLDRVPLGIEVDQILAEYAVRLRTARARLASAVALLPQAGAQIDRQGRVSLDPAVPRQPVHAGPTVTQVSAQVGAALTVADAADREAAARLTGLADALAGSWAEPPGAYRPPVGADPALVRLWWDRLTPAQRRWLVGHEPALVGRLDGVPATARDQANRLLLGTRRAALLAERSMIAARLPQGPLELAALRHLDGRIAGIDGIAGRLAEGVPRGYLLGLDQGGDGRAIVALGNPDRAANVLTYVPGMTSDLASLDGELGRAARVAARCAELDPTTETAAVLWLDYDAPDFVGEASRDRQAVAAGPALHRFQEGLRETHDGPPARQTVLGHSYGSLVVGTAARDHGLSADALVFVGSPGVGVESAAELRTEPGRVWASTADDDLIRYTRPPAELAGRMVLGGLPTLLFGRDDDHWFGTDPSGTEFGGRTFPSGRHGHTGYWDHDNPALDGMARIVLDRTG